jgi:hypothetical protein
MEKETVTEEKLRKLAEFMKKEHKRPGKDDDNDLRDMIHHVRHCKSSNFGYPSLRKRFPELCEIIRTIDREIYVEEKLDQLKKILLEENRVPEKKKSDVEMIFFWDWAKNQRMKYSFLYFQKEEMEIDIQINMPNKKDIDKKRKELGISITAISEENDEAGEDKETPKKRKKDLPKEVIKFYTDFVKLEEFVNKVNAFKKAKEDLRKHYMIFMESPWEDNFKFDLELASGFNDYLSTYQEILDWFDRKNLVKKAPKGSDKPDETITNLELLTKDNMYIKEVIDDFETRKIIFKG